jgi:hypothetical protein
MSGRFYQVLSIGRVVPNPHKDLLYQRYPILDATSCMNAQANEGVSSSVYPLVTSVATPDQI